MEPDRGSHPDLDPEDVEDVRAKLAVRYGDAAPAKIYELLTAQEVSETLGDTEDAAWTRFRAVPLTSAA